MEKADILAQLNEIFKDILDREDIRLRFETTASEIDDWDSLNHIQLVVAMERHFGIRFNAAEIQSWKNVAEMVDSIQKKLPGN